MDREWIITLVVLLLVSLAEWLHHRRLRRLGRLAFKPGTHVRRWTAYAPALRALACGLLAWSLSTLWMIAPKTSRPEETPEGGYRHLIIALDVSPSMQLRDAGPDHAMTRAQRASQILTSVLERTALDQVRVSIVAFYTGAKPVVVDTFDIEVVKNVLDDLPLDYAFDIGKTTLLKGLEESAALAKDWKENSAVLVLVSDGDTVSDSGMPKLPKSIKEVLVVGVGDPRLGKFIDGHQSRQDASTLRQVASRLNGFYHDGNQFHLPSEQLAQLSKVLPMKDQTQLGMRELALVTLCIGATILAGLPLALRFFGCGTQVGRVTPCAPSQPNLSNSPVGRVTPCAPQRLQFEESKQPTTHHSPHLPNENAPTGASARTQTPDYISN